MTGSEANLSQWTGCFLGVLPSVLTQKCMTGCNDCRRPIVNKGRWENGKINPASGQPPPTEMAEAVEATSG